MQQPIIDPRDEQICLGHDEVPEHGHGPLAPPIVQTSLFGFESLASLDEGLADEYRNSVYSRGNNPTVGAVESKLAVLEHGEACRCFGSGMAAVAAVLLGCLDAGDHVLFVNRIYGPTRQLAARLRRLGITHDVVAEDDDSAPVPLAERLEAALRESTRMIWIESPGTMTFRQVDLRAIARIGRGRGIRTVIDNSWATPLFQKPLELGIDVAVHAASKYLGGHSDLIAGAVIGDAATMERIFYDASLLLGGVLAPFDAFLLNRGLRTLPVRMRQHHTAGLEVAALLDAHPAVRRVFHPAFGDADGAVRSQLSGYAGLLAFELDSGSAAEVARFVDALRCFRIGVSWGGPESLVIAPYRGTETASDLPRGLVRLSVGLEPPALLCDDLTHALEGFRDA